MSTKLFPISALADLVVTRWQGMEMALAEADTAIRLSIAPVLDDAGSTITDLR
jgi:hypothetical protein